MGRMLDTLRFGDARRAAPASKLVDESPEQDRVVDWEIGEEVPFVEVGGPSKKLELSPGLTKHPPQPMPKPPHVVVETTKPVRSALPQATKTQALSVAFEPWPGTGPSLSAVSPEVIAYHQPDSTATREYAALLDAMLAGTQGSASPVLLLCGVKPQVGASTVLLNLGVVAAQARRRRVVLVDANAPRVGLAQRLGATVSGGLADVLAGSLALEQALARTGVDALTVLPAGNAPLAITGAAMGWLVAWLRERHDLVLIDGPTLDAADALARQAPHADGVYVVLARSDASALGKAGAAAIQQAGGRMCGLIHTQVA